jgi:hypothetical protein
MFDRLCRCHRGMLTRLPASNETDGAARGPARQPADRAGADRRVPAHRRARDAAVAPCSGPCVACQDLADCSFLHSCIVWSAMETTARTPVGSRRRRAPTRRRSWSGNRDPASTWRWASAACFVLQESRNILRESQNDCVIFVDLEGRPVRARFVAAPLSRRFAHRRGKQGDHKGRPCIYDE